MPRSPEEVRKAKREWQAKKRVADPEGQRAYQRRLHHANRDRNLAKMRDYYARRFFWGRAMKLRGESRATTADLARLWRQQRGRCALTGRRLTRDNAHLDHIVAKARGGTDEAANLRWLCTEANLALRELSDTEFAALCSDVMRWIGERIQQVEVLEPTAPFPRLGADTCLRVDGYPLSTGSEALPESPREHHARAAGADLSFHPSTDSAGEAREHA